MSCHVHYILINKTPLFFHVLDMRKSQDVSIAHEKKSLTRPVSEFLSRIINDSIMY